MSKPQFAPLIFMAKIWTENHYGRLRLRWNYQGKRVSLSLGVDDDPAGRALSRQKAAQIELDLISGNYDPSLLKYKPRTIGKNRTELTTVELFEKFTKARLREKKLSRGGLSKYECVSKYLKSCFGTLLAEKVTRSKAEKLVSAMLESVTPQTCKQYLFLISACFEWGAGQFHLPSENPFEGMASKIEADPARRVKPFSEDEIRAILQGFRTSEYYSFYYPVVQFLFGVGCRLGEAFALCWSNVSEDFSCVTICDSVSRGQIRGVTKTGASRVVHLSDRLIQAMKERAKQSGRKPSDLVFPGRSGKPMSDLNFRERAWRSVLESVGVEYRSPYNIRHTVISHALSDGINPIELAEQTGHSPQVMLKTYAHAIKAKSLFKEFS